MLDTEVYRAQNEMLLSDVNAYLKLVANPTAAFQLKLSNLLLDGVHLGELSPRQMEFIMVQHPITAVFHSLPKIHKGGFPPPFRPIVAGIGSLNERLCGWVDSFLQPLIPQIPGYLQDTKQVLSQLKDRVWVEGSVWITADVSSLYAVISHDRAIVVLEWFMDTYGTNSQDLKLFVTMAMHFLLKHNFFMFDSNFYLQTTGVLMGAKFSPAIVNIYMAWWESSFLFSDQNPFVSGILWYSRYMDDLLFIADVGMVAMPGFNAFLDSMPYGGNKFSMRSMLWSFSAPDFTDDF